MFDLNAVKYGPFGPIRRCLERHHMKVELKRLKALGKHHQILRDSDYETTGPAQGEWCSVYRKGTAADRSASLFSSPLSDEALWWIIRRHREKAGCTRDEALSTIISSVIKGYFVDPFSRLRERARMRAELQELRVNGKLDPILHASPYELIREGSVVHRTNKDGYYFTSVSKDEAIWWIVQRHLEEKGKTKP